MIVEHRMYTFRPGAVDGWLKKYEAEGLPVQKRHLGRYLGLYVSEIGRLHTIVLMWAYEDLADRERRRALRERRRAAGRPDGRRVVSAGGGVSSVVRRVRSVGRAVGSGARRRSIASASPRAMSATISATGRGRSRRILTASSTAEPRPCGGSPVTSSYQRAPSE